MIKEGSRKFTVIMIFMSAAIILLVNGNIDKTDWLFYVSAVVGGYFGGNVGEHIAKRILK